MYPYDFKPSHFGINHREIFVIMPFDNKFDPIFNDLICPATKTANKKLNLSEQIGLIPFRTKDDIRTQSGWINVLEHLTTAQINIGVLVDKNPNVFYELGIAHSTQPIARQILLTSKSFKRPFDTKDLIDLEFDSDDLQKFVDPLSDKIVDAITVYNLDRDKKVHLARMSLGPHDFGVMMNHGNQRNFAIKTADETFKKNYEKVFGQGALGRNIIGIQNLCFHGLLGLNTASTPKVDGTLYIEFSYWWTSLGNDVLRILKVIDEKELHKRREGLPDFF